MTYRNLLERIRNLICLEEQADELGERGQFRNILVAEMQVAAVDGAWTTHTDHVMYALDKLTERRNTLHSMLKDYFTQAGLDWREILPKEEKAAPPACPWCRAGWPFTNERKTHHASMFASGGAPPYPCERAQPTEPEARAGGE